MENKATKILRPTSVQPYRLELVMDAVGALLVSPLSVDVPLLVLLWVLTAPSPEKCCLATVLPQGENSSVVHFVLQSSLQDQVKPNLQVRPYLYLVPSPAASCFSHVPSTKSTPSIHHVKKNPHLRLCF